MEDKLHLFPVTKLWILNMEPGALDLHKDNFSRHTQTTVHGIHDAAVVCDYVCMAHAAYFIITR